MAEHFYPCPSCGQQQRKTEAAGVVVTPENCPACAETAEEAEALAQLVEREGSHAAAAKRKK